MENQTTHPHVLYVENSPGFGGSTRCVQALAGSCVQQGWQATVALATPLPPGEAMPNGVRVAPCWTKKHNARPGLEFALLPNRMRALLGLLSRDWPLARQLAAYARLHQVDLIHANNELLANRVAIAAGCMAGIPVISHQRGWGRSCVLTRVLSGGVRRFIAISQAVKHDMLKMGIPSSLIVQTYDGIPSHRPQTSTETRAELRRKFGWSEGDLVVGMPAVITEWKGHRLFLKAFAELAREFPHARALIVGDCLPTNGSYLQELRELVHRLGITAQVLFTGHVRDIAGYYAAMDLVVHGSLAPEPLGLVVIEALAAGRAVLAANAGGPAEIITHAQNGWLYRMGDQGELRDALFRLAVDPILRQRLGQAGMARAEAFRHDNCWSAIADLYADVLREQLHRTRGFSLWPSRPSYSSSALSSAASAPFTPR